MTTVRTTAEILVTGYARARRAWPAGHVIHVDLRGYCFLNGRPADGDTCEITITPLPLRLEEAQQILDRLEAEVVLAGCLDERDRCSAPGVTTAAT
jgi:hypothetical protein